jgi:predicted lipoprotein with Yx(FWY)xxD motif
MSTATSTSRKSSGRDATAANTSAASSASSGCRARASGTRSNWSGSGACAGFWPPLIASAKPLAGPGVQSRLLGTTRRPDGRLQVTYDHHPLYSFVKDVRKGDTKGEGLDAFGAEWYALSAGGAKVETDSGSAGAYGYGSGY